MKWFSRMIEHFDRNRLLPEEQQRERRVRRRLDDADPVIREYKKLDLVLNVHARRAHR